MRPIHTNEDTQKPENRTSLALLSVLQIEEIHGHLLHRLGLPEESLICPCPNLETEEFGQVPCDRWELQTVKHASEAIGKDHPNHARADDLFAFWRPQHTPGRQSRAARQNQT